VLWNSESAVPSGLMPMILDRALGLPEQDWVGLDQIGREVAVTTRHRRASGDGYKPGMRSGTLKVAARKTSKRRKR
jgi:hypothetical protein